ncbi:MAG: MATE family efflux transporter [Lachnospiraceae bacterium]|nr:MATE family efflux transporter [Lachnospiraceae bacterium]
MTQEEKFVYMTEKPVEMLVGKLAVPTVISMLVTSFYNMVDTYFVGKINTSASGAVGITFSLMAIIQAFGFMFGHGSGNYISRKLGEQDTEEAARMANAGFAFAFAWGVILAICGNIFLEPLARLLGSTETILPYAKAYMGPILVGAPWVMTSFVLNNQIRYQGNAMTSMIGIVIGAIINIALDPLLMFKFNMGIAGAAVATIVSQLISFLLLLGATRFGGNIRITLKKNPFAWNLLPEIIKGGFPSLCRQGLASLSVTLLNTTAKNVAELGYADATIAGMSIVSRIIMFANSTVIGIGQGFQPVCGFNYGAGNYKRVKDAFAFCVKICCAFLIIVSIFGFVFAPDITAIFIKKDEVMVDTVISVGSFALRAQCISLVLSSWVVITNMLLQASGQALWASLIASCRQGICFIPVLFILSALLGIRGVQISQAVADVFSFGISLVGGIMFLKKLGRMEKETA